jgi:V/A-type H+-transporting ATPase subunit I
MAIEKMEKIRLIAVSSQRDEILRELMLLGCVEILEPAASPENELLAKLTRFDGAELYRCKSDYAVLSNGVKQLDKYAPEKKSFLSPLPEAAMDELLDETKIPECLVTAERLNALDEQIRRIAADESRERTAIESFRPWEALSMPLDCKGTERAAAIAGTFPASVQLGDAEAALAAATEMAQVVPVSADKNLHYVVLVCLREEQEDVLAALRPLEFSVMRLGEGKGTAREAIAASEAKLAGYAAQKEELAEQIAAEAPRRAEMQLRADTMSTKIARAEAASRLLCTESAFVFQGWLPVSSESGLAQVLSKYDCAWETERRTRKTPRRFRSNSGATG